MSDRRLESASRAPISGKTSPRTRAPPRCRRYRSRRTRSSCPRGLRARSLRRLCAALRLSSGPLFLSTWSFPRIGSPAEHAAAFRFFVSSLGVRPVEAPHLLKSHQPVHLGEGVERRG